MVRLRFDLQTQMTAIIEKIALWNFDGAVQVIQTYRFFRNIQ